MGLVCPGVLRGRCRGHWRSCGVGESASYCDDPIPIIVQVVLRRLHIIPTPTPPEPPRSAPPKPLSLEELDKLKIVCFVPDPTEPPAEPSSPTPSRSTIVTEPFEPSRLPYPAIILKAHQSTCAICQENFSPPQAGRAILLKADPLRMLGCDHVFHVNPPFPLQRER